MQRIENEDTLQLVVGVEKAALLECLPRTQEMAADEVPAKLLILAIVLNQIIEVVQGGGCVRVRENALPRRSTPKLRGAAPPVA